jgi:arsenate reductase-like glutaredoxin family protein
MDYYNMNDVPDEVIDIAEQKITDEEDFISFLEKQGVRDSSNVSEEKWKAILKALEDFEDDDYDY